MTAEGAQGPNTRSVSMEFHWELRGAMAGLPVEEAQAVSRTTNSRLSSMTQRLASG